MIRMHRLIPIVLLLSGCAAANRDFEVVDHGQVPVPAADESMVVFFNEQRGYSARYVYVDGRRAAVLDGGSYTIIPVEPGDRVISSKDTHERRFDFHIEAGAVHYIRVTLEDGVWAPYVHIVEVPEETALYVIERLPRVNKVSAD